MIPNRRSGGRLCPPLLNGRTSLDRQQNFGGTHTNKARGESRRRAETPATTLPSQVSAAKKKATLQSQ